MRHLSRYLLLLLFFAVAPGAYAGIIVPTQVEGATVQLGISGVCAGCQIENPAYVVTEDPSDYATVSIPLGVAAGGWISVTFSEEVAKGAKVGFRIGTSGLLDLGVLNEMTIRTYRNGVERVSGTGASVLKLSLLSDGSGRVMMNARKPFDEARIYVGSLLGVSRDVRVYNAFAIPKRSPTTWVEVPSVGTSAAVAAGAEGVLCVPIIAPCEVRSESNVVSEDLDAAARMSLPLGVGATAWIDVFLPEDQAGKPKAGFVIEDQSGLLGLQLLDALTVTTYRDGSVQQSATGTAELGVKPLGGDKVFVYFRARQRFDQIRLTSQAVLSIGVEIDVYHARLQFKAQSRPAVAGDVPAALLTEGPDAPLALTVPAPNPTAGLSRLALTAAAAQHVRVRVFDVAGREVAVPFEGLIGAGETAEIAVDGRALPSGVYVVRAEGAGRLATQRLTIVR